MPVKFIAFSSRERHNTMSRDHLSILFETIICLELGDQHVDVILHESNLIATIHLARCDSNSLVSLLAG